MNCELMLAYDTPAYMFNVYKNQLGRQTGSRILTGPKTLPTIWHTYMKLVTKYQILPSIVAEKNATKNILDGRKDRQVKQYAPPPVGYNNKIVDPIRMNQFNNKFLLSIFVLTCNQCLPY